MEPVTSGLEGEWFIHYTTAAPGKAGYYICKYSKTCLKQPLSKIPKMFFQDQLSLNAGKSIAECSNILQYFRPSLSYHLS